MTGGVATELTQNTENETRCRTDRRLGSCTALLSWITLGNRYSLSNPSCPPRRRTQVLIAAAIAWTYCVTFLRALRPPNDFAEAHWLLDYRFGFVKRGLAGMLLSAFTVPFGIQPSERTIAVVSYVVFV